MSETETITVIATESETVTITAPGPQGVGVPAGGSASQLLHKNSSTDYDTAWSTYEDNTHSWSKQQYYALSTLTIGAGNAIDWDWNIQPEAKVTLPNGVAHTLNMPANRQPGVRTLRVYQDSTGGGTLAFSSGYIVDTGLAALTFVANSFLDLFFKDDGTHIIVFGAEYQP